MVSESRPNFNEKTDILHSSRVTAHSEGILPLSEQRGATGPYYALIENRPYLHYRRAETISFLSKLILTTLGLSNHAGFTKPALFRNGF